jgi:hypothetical protein
MSSRKADADVIYSLVRDTFTISTVREFVREARVQGR